MHSTTKKTISVIVTTYNSEKTIDRALRSIMNQEGRGKEFDIELIVADDCSTDRTIERVREYDAIILSTEQNSGGPNKGRNLGLSRAIGDYFCIVDHDDEWLRHKIITQLPYLEKAPIVTCGCIFYDETTNTSFEHVIKSENEYRYFGKNQTFLERLAWDFSNQNAYESGAIYWEALKNIPYEEFYGMVDYDRQLKLYHNRDSIEVCQPLFYRYVHQDNLSKKGKYWNNDGYKALVTIGQYANEYPIAARQGMQDVFGKIARYYYLYADNMVMARFFFWKSKWSWKTFAFIITSYVGSGYVKKRMKKVTGDISLQKEADCN